MSRSFAQDVYLQMLDSPHGVTLRGIERKEYETIRTSLYRNHRSMKDLGGVDEDTSICASWKDGTATFRFGTNTRERKTFTIEVIPGEEVSGLMESDSQERNSHDNLS